jgi:hypothetical protein
MRYALPRIAVLAASLISGIAWPGCAQRKPPATMSTELREALHSSPVVPRGGGAHEITSALPPDFPEDLIPPGSSVGTVAIASGLVTAVFIAPKMRASGTLQYEASLETNGWLIGAQRRGQFIRAGSMSLPNSLCRTGVFVRPTYQRRAEGGYLVRVAVERDDRRGCAVLGAPPLADVPWPSLVLPSGAEPERGAGGGVSGSSMRAFSARVRAEMQAAPLEQHLSTQLIELGWTPVGGAMSGPTGSYRQFRTTTRSGDRVIGVVAVTELGPGNLFVMFQGIRELPTNR